MSYVEPLSPRNKDMINRRHVQGINDDFTKYTTLQCSSGGFTKHSYPMKYWPLKTNLMLVYSIYKGLVYATVFIESNKFQYF